jgi:signal transduction histidine kinase/CheY-like chemotaxis protein
VKKKAGRARRPRIDRLFDLIGRMAAGELDARAPISPRHDEVDALAFGLNLLGGELQHTLQHLTQARDAAERANEARAVFLRTVSHELRTPISAILGLAELLGAPEVTEREYRRLGDRIMQNGRALLRLVDHLLDLSRIEAERIDVARDALAPAALVREVVEMLEVETTRKSLPVQVSVARDTPREVKSDPVRLRQILFNVVGNAIKFTEAGRVDVSVRRLRGRDDDGVTEDMVAIDVEDTGMGIAEEDQSRLFQPFARARAGARPREGHGLGLALSRRLAQALGGNLILVSSMPGKGSTFRLTIPAEEPGVAAVGTGAELALPPARDAQQLTGVKLLVADDHEDLRSALELLLVDAGAQVETACDGQQAFDRATASKYDVVLLDVEMPIMTGLEVASRLRARGDQTPIIAVTAHAMREERERCLDAGCNGVVVKPFDIQALITEILAQMTRAQPAPAPRRKSRRGIRSRP